MNGDGHARTEEARQQLPIRRLMEQHGAGPKAQGENWRRFACPFCRKKAAGLFQAKPSGVELFKCFHSQCPTQGEALDEAGYLAEEGGMSRRDAWVAWLKEAGVWRDERLGPSVMPGTRPRKATVLQEPDVDAIHGERSDPVRVGESSPLDAPTALPFPKDNHGDVVPPPADEAPPSETCASPEGGGTASSHRVAHNAVTPPGVAVDLPASPELRRTSGDGGSPEEGGPPHSAIDEGLKALRAFHARTALSPGHLESLRTKRGFSPGWIEACGFRSSSKSNRALLEQMASEFGVEAMLAAGLYQKADEGERPNPQFCGWGVVGKKLKTDEEDDDEFEWDWVEPVLIPYFDAWGQVISIRPHKGMGRRGTASGVPRLYIARGGQPDRARYDTVVITEGEFKACALKEVLPQMGVASLPGISMAKHGPIQAELGRLLRTVKARRVVVVFDNEEKGDPKLPGFKADPAKRFEAQVWARYLARWTSQRGFHGCVAQLPDTWRINGKADWDGALAMLRASGEDPAIAFTQVIKSAAPAGRIDQLALFDKHSEQIIRNRLVRIEYEPMLPFGGDRELDMAQKFDRLGRDGDWADAARARMLGKAFRKVVGWYYRRAPVRLDKELRAHLTMMRDLLEKEVATANWDALDPNARHALQVARDRLEFFKQFLLGTPDGVADFRMDAKFAVVRPNGDRELLVSIRNRLGKRVVPLDMHSFTAPRDFKEWVAKQGPFSWMTGETELEQLRHDMNQLSAFREVHLVTICGWHANSRLWFAGDCAIAADGSMLLPDADGVFWHNGLGYLSSQTDWEGEGFAMGRPTWQPTRSLHWSTDGLSLQEGGEDDMVALQELLQSLGQALNETLGGTEGYLVLGAVLSFAAAPEFFEREKWFPGLWIHGERGSGKTCLARWMMRLWGLDLEGGVNLPNCSKVGMQIAAQQYCNLPLWLEEYQSTLETPKIEMVKSLYNREPALKKEFGEQRRKIASNAIITGEATAHDSATRQRFPHVQVSDKRRKGNTQAWFQSHERFFFALAAMYCAIVGRLWRRWSRCGASGSTTRISGEVTKGANRCTA